MFLDGKTKQAAVFIGRDQLESTAIAGFLRIGPAPPCVRRRALGVIASGLDGPRGIPDVAVAAAQTDRLGHPGATPKQKDSGRASRHGHSQGCSHQSIPRHAESRKKKKPAFGPNPGSPSLTVAWNL